MKKTFIGLTSMAFLAGGTPAFSMNNAELQSQLQELITHNKHLTERIQKLEKQMARQQAAGTAVAPSEDEGATSFLKTLTDRVKLSAVVEVEANATDDDINNEDTSDITLATVEIGVDAQITDWSSAHILLLYEDDDDDGTGDLNIDEGTITLGNLEKFPLYLTTGKMYVPFGSYESNMVADPLTLEIGETNDSAVQLGFAAVCGFYGSVYGFNGDIEETGKDDQIDAYGANIGYVIENDKMALDMGVDWINNIADTDGISDHLDVTVASEINDYVDGISVHAMFTMGPFSMIGEYVAALDDFEAAEVAWKTGGAEPEAYNIEAAFTTELFNRETTFALGYQATDEAVDLGLVEDLYIAAVSMEILPHTNLAIEYSLGDDYSTSDGGTGDDITSTTMQLAVEF